MRLTEASVELRPRSPMEAIDLGVLLARRHRCLLMSSWAIVTLPVFVLLSLTFHDRPYLAVLIFWWLKPAFERLPLLILSQALFGAVPSLRQALKAWPATLKSQLPASLLWRRLSLSRSFLLPVQQLENLSGGQRAQRVETLSRRDLRHARLLTLFGLHLETILWLGLALLLFALVPQQMETEWFWRNLLATNVEANWLDHLSNLLYALVLVVWEPVYVACGFTLYLNRRTVLEAWDIELVFRRLRQRLTGSAYLMLIGTTLVLAPTVTPAWADERTMVCPLPQPAALSTDAMAPDAPRLMRQSLSSEAAQQSIKAVLQQPPFSNLERVSGWRFPETTAEARSSSSGAGPDSFFAWIERLVSSARAVARFFEIILWAALFALVAMLIWRYRMWFAAFVPRKPRAAEPSRETPEQLFGLRIGVETLPDDIASSAERLWSSQPREALGLLYRALLSRLLVEHRLSVTSADTEGEILARIASLDNPALDRFSRSLTLHWQNLAYGHQLPPASARIELCSGWRQLFESGTAA